MADKILLITGAFLAISIGIFFYIDSSIGNNIVFFLILGIFFLVAPLIILLLWILYLLFPAALFIIIKITSFIHKKKNKVINQYVLSLPEDDKGWADLLSQRRKKIKLIVQSIRITFLLILLMTVIGGYFGVKKFHRNLEETKSRGKKIVCALEDFRNKTGKYPKHLEELGVIIEEPLIGNKRWGYCLTLDENFMLMTSYGFLNMLIWDLKPRQWRQT